MEQTQDMLINDEEKLFGEISEEELAKIKASLEYEMTTVMLNLRGKFDRVDKKNVQQNEYLEKEIEKPQLSYDIPVFEAAGIGCELPDTKVSLADTVLNAEPVSVDAIPFETAVPEIPVISEIRAEQIQSEIQIPEISDANPAVCFPALEVSDPEQMRSAAAESIPEIPPAFSAPVLADAAAAVSLANSIRISIPAETAELTQFSPIPEPVWNDIRVDVPAASVDNSVFAIPSAEPPAASVPDVPVPEHISESSFLLPPPGEVKINMQYEPVKATEFQIPVMPAPAIRSTAAQDYPEIPEMPDFSGAVSEILAAAMSEI